MRMVLTCAVLPAGHTTANPQPGSRPSRRHCWTSRRSNDDSKASQLRSPLKFRLFLTAVTIIVLLLILLRLLINGADDVDTRTALFGAGTSAVIAYQ